MLQIIKRVPFVGSILTLGYVFVFFIFIEFPYCAVKFFYCDALVSYLHFKNLLFRFKIFNLERKNQILLFENRKLLLKQRNMLLLHNSRTMFNNDFTKEVR